MSDFTSPRDPGNIKLDNPTKTVEKTEDKDLLEWLQSQRVKVASIVYVITFIIGVGGSILGYYVTDLLTKTKLENEIQQVRADLQGEIKARENMAANVNAQYREILTEIEALKNKDAEFKSIVIDRLARIETKLEKR